MQCTQALLSWGTLRPDAIVGNGPDEQKKILLREMIRVAQSHWNTVAGVLRPNKSNPMLLKVLLPVLKFLDLRVNVDLRDSLLFLLSFVCGMRAKEVVNITWKDVTILDGGNAVLINARPFKNSTRHGSTHPCQFGRRAFKQVDGGGGGGVIACMVFMYPLRHFRCGSCIHVSYILTLTLFTLLPNFQVCLVEQILHMGSR